MRPDWWKTPLDYLVLLFAHVLLFPVWLVVWILVPLAIWLYDRGPVFYTQQRIGKDGVAFEILKFRSMVRDAECLTGPVASFINDTRITPVGRFLRSASLDEVPQVINILRRDMSFVGPRAEQLELHKHILKECPDYWKRLHVLPGLTGIAQVYGRYNTVPRNKLRYDMLYIRRMAPLLDIKLIFMSGWITLRAKWQSLDR